MIEQLLGKRIEIPSQFPAPVIVEDISVIEDEVLLTIRTNDGLLKEAQISLDEANLILLSAPELKMPRVDADAFFLLSQHASQNYPL